MMTRFVLWRLVLLIADARVAHAADTTPRLASEQPPVQANCNGVPIKRFGFCWVLGKAPLLKGVLVRDWPLVVRLTDR